MKIPIRVLVILSLSILFGILMVGNVASAYTLEDAMRDSEADLSREGNDPITDDPSGWDTSTRSTGETSTNPSANPPTPSGGSSRPQSVQDEFNVNEYLKAPGQVSKVPSGSEGGGAVFFVVQVIELMIKLIGGVALVIFMIGGILVIVAQGKEDMLERGKNAMVYSVIGLVVAFFSFIIVTFVQSILFK